VNDLGHISSSVKCVGLMVAGTGYNRLDVHLCESDLGVGMAEVRLPTSDIMLWSYGIHVLLPFSWGSNPINQCTCDLNEFNHSLSHPLTFFQDRGGEEEDGQIQKRGLKLSRS
jgi:hypothetical protein